MSSIPSRISRVHYQRGQVGLNPLAEDAVFRFHDRFRGSDSVPPFSETVQDKERTVAGSGQTLDLSETVSQDNRPFIIVHSGHVSWPPTLQGPSATQGFPFEERAHIFSECTSFRGGQVRTPVVGGPHACMERQSHIRLSSGSSDRIGCQWPRLGCPVWRSLYRRKMVLRRTDPSHQLPRTNGGFIRGEVLDQRECRVVSSSRWTM